MKQLDWKSFAIGVLLITTVMFGTGAATSTTTDPFDDAVEKWDAKQKWEVKTSGRVISEGWEPFAYDSNDKFDPVPPPPSHPITKRIDQTNPLLHLNAAGVLFHAVHNPVAKRRT